MCSRWEFDDGEGNYFSWTVAGPNLEVRKYVLENITCEADGKQLRSIDEGGAQIQKPIATFYPHKRYIMVGMISQHAFLEIEPSAVDSLDTILGAIC